ncbi:stonustoxin subunit beta [Etheostoma spectabile]|uniref:stonustoxin subunit beta n=1 Tax=Etheostoma spectabile TaxID=54343 RepID=UPI0013AF31C3|nr:stonustoxin subunit beta-like [Etheostoma spectabile]
MKDFEASGCGLSAHSLKTPTRPDFATILSETNKPDWMHLTSDNKTANKMLWISDSGFKVLRRTVYSPQVVGKEVIWNMRAYWEVEYSGWVVIGVTYEGAGRRAHSRQCGFGENEESWGLSWSGTCYQIWLNSMINNIKDLPCCSTIGVYIDQSAGVINFYNVTGEGAEKEVKLL